MPDPSGANSFSIHFDGEGADARVLPAPVLIEAIAQIQRGVLLLAMMHPHTQRRVRPALPSPRSGQLRLPCGSQQSEYTLFSDKCPPSVDNRSSSTGCSGHLNSQAWGNVTEDADDSPTGIMMVLEKAYETASRGVPRMGVKPVAELAADYMSNGGSPREQANSLIRWQNTKAATTGFVTGLGGFFTMPIAVPADVSMVFLVQVRMIAAIAVIGGYDVNDDRVKTLVYACMAGNGTKEILRNVGIQLGRKLTTTAIKRLVTRKTVVAINRAVGFRLVTKFGEKGVINLGKLVPIVGGVVGATVDGVYTNAIGNTARDVFIPQVRTPILGADGESRA